MKLEPALVSGAVAAIVTLVVAFGVPLTVEQKAAILGVIAPVIALVQAVATRQVVVPTAKVDREVEARVDAALTVATD